MSRSPLLTLPTLFVLCTLAHAAPPTVADDHLVIELAASEPDIVTPTGLTVDEQGRVWVIENNTHQRQADYKGPDSDRIRVFSDPGADGKFRKIATFADGFKNAMSITLGRNGDIYLATRSDIWLLRDTKGNGTADERKAIVKLETKGDYPHNGLSGFAWAPNGDLYFSLGENLGAAYKLVGSDGTAFSGGGEGGSIYKCRPDGSKLERIATGFWNAFGLTFDAFGRLFAVDNDPDARGPCRLLHIVPGGDYGYRFRYGRSGLHPFVAWNGELPGTLPMVAGTAEAPSGIIAYESSGLPKEYIGRLLVTSWGDHVVEQFTLQPRGASFGAKSSVLIRGGEDFRPVGIATAPDGSLYLSDWVDKSYPVHGKGRIWHLRMKNPPKDDRVRETNIAGLDVDGVRKLLADPRREVRSAVAAALAGKGLDSEGKLMDALQHSLDVRARLQALWAMSTFDPSTGDLWLNVGLKDADPEIRGEAARLAGARMAGDRSDDKLLRAAATKDGSSYVRMQAILQLRQKESLEAIVPALGDLDPFLSAAAITALARPGNQPLLARAAVAPNPKSRLGALVALRRSRDAGGTTFLKIFLADDDPAVRRAAVQWVGEEHLQEYKDAMATAAAKEPVTRELFEALLTSQELLANPDGKTATEGGGELNVARIVKDAKQPVVFRTLGLRMLRPDHPALTASLLKEMLENPELALQAEAVRTLSQRTDKDSQDLLRRLAGDEHAPIDRRAFAVLGLAQSATTSPETRRLLLSLLADSKLRRDALRSLRDCPLDADEWRALFAWWEKLPAEKEPSADRRELAELVMLVVGSKPAKEDEGAVKQIVDLVKPHPTDEAGWQKVLFAEGDAAAGERVFFHLRGPRCAVCHRIDGRGGQVGPDLSAIGRSSNRTKLLESILTPSKEIAPAYTTWLLTMRSGKMHTGVIISENFDSTITFAEADGKPMVLKRLDIEDRQASPKSLMPDDLHKQMTRREFLDLLSYLETRGK